ncbi:MAG: iron ABC transporter permease [Thaumarchaeota archaeon]|nr:iron ABC transporter permease [Nitrososphaerota archaeon]
MTASRTPALLAGTLEYALGTVLLTIVLAAPYAWLVVRTNVPGKSFLRLLPIFPLVLPNLVGAISWIFLLSPQIGLVNLAVENVTGIGFAPFDVFSMGGLIFVTAIGAIPITYLMLEGAFLSLDPSHEEASQISGAGTWKTLRYVTIPLVAPQILAAFMLGVLFVVGVFEYPFILGSRVHIANLATQVYLLMDVTSQYSLAAAYGLIYLVLTIIIISLYLFAVRRSYRFVTVTGRPSVATLFDLGRWRWVALAVCLGIITVVFFLPFATLIIVSLVPYYTIGPGIGPFSAGLTLTNFVDALKTISFQQSVFNSFELYAASAVIATILGTMMAYVLIKGKTRGKVILNYISNLPLAFPGIVYGVGLIWMFLVLPGVNSLYGTTWVMLIALVVIWLPISIRFSANSLIQLADELEESASVVGSRWSRTFVHVLFPLLKPTIVNSFLYMFVDSFKEVGVVILLTGPSSSLLTTLILSTYSGSGGTLPVVAAMSVLMCLMLIGSILVIRIVAKNRKIYPV